MNPNELLAQQQALLNQAMQNAQQQTQQQMWAIWAIALALFIIQAWVIYMFYARLRDIANELLKIRVTYEMEQERAVRGVAASPRPASGDNPFASDAPYMPKR